MFVDMWFKARFNTLENLDVSINDFVEDMNYEWKVIIVSFIYTY